MPNTVLAAGDIELPMMSLLRRLYYLMEVTGRRVVMYGCESWTIKKAECRRIDSFKL